MYYIHLGAFIRICDKPLPLEPENLFKNYRVMDKWQYMHIDYQIIIFLIKSKFRNQPGSTIGELPPVGIEGTGLPECVA